MATDLSMIIAQLPPYLQEQFPHYEETLRPNIYAATGICLVIAYVCVGLRLYGRRLQAQALWWDDYMSIVALIFASVSAAVLLYITYLGWGRHEIVLIFEHPKEIGTFLRLLIGVGALYPVSICFSKLSILFQYRRLFPARNFKWVLIAVGTASTCYCVISMIVLTSLCLPVKVLALDDPRAQHPLACDNIKTIVLWICSWNAAFDFIVLLLPMHYVWALKVTLRRKLQLTFVFLFGFFVVAISILRTWYFTKLEFNDFTWSSSLGNMWSEVEGCMAIVVSCLPAMMPVFRGSCLGRKGPGGSNPTAKIHLVTFGSGGRKNKLRDISTTMTTTTDATRNGDGNYTELTDQFSHDGRPRQYQQQYQYQYQY